MQPHPYAQRRDRLSSYVQQQGLDGFIVTNPKNVRYLTGFTGEATYLLINQRNQLMVSDGRFSDQLQEECPGMPLSIRPPGQKLTPAALQQLKSLDWNNIGCESGHLTLAEFEVFRTGLPAVQWKPMGEAIEQFRMLKDASEIEAIQNAIAIAERAYVRFCQFIKPQDNEIQLHHRMEMLLRDEGGECGSFPAIIAAGSRAALPHAPPTSLALANQELLLVDWGAHARGYVSDLTRTCSIRMNVTSRLKTIYDAVLAAQAAAVAVMKPGTPAFAVDVAARQAIESRGLTPYSHGLGHGIGLDVHEAPQMRPGIETILLPGMVVTVEPGIYVPGWGGVRIEDDYLITTEGPRQLTTLPKDWESAIMG